MDIPLPDDVNLQLERLQAAVDGLEQHLKPLLEADLQELEQALPQEQAERHLAVGRALAVLYTLYAKTAGLSVDSFKKDLDRLQLYQKKVAKVSYDQELAGAKRTLTLDVAAANRFIDAAIPDMTLEQRAALQQAAAGKKRRVADEAPAEEQSAAEMADAVIADVLGGN